MLHDVFINFYECIAMNVLRWIECGERHALNFILWMSGDETIMLWKVCDESYGCHTFKQLNKNETQKEICDK